MKTRGRSRHLLQALLKVFDFSFSRVYWLGVEPKVVIGVESLSGCRVPTLNRDLWPPTFF